MRASVFGSAVMAVAFGASFHLACALMTDLDELSGKPNAGADAGGAPPSEAGAGVDAARSPDADAAPSSSYAAEVLSDAPVAYYRFEDSPDAETAKDEVGEHTASVVTKSAKGVVFGVPGARGTGVSLDGMSSFDVGDVFDFAGKVPFTLEVWVKPKAKESYGNLIQKLTETSFDGYRLGLSDGEPSFTANRSGVAGPDQRVSLGAGSEAPLPLEFTHLVVTVVYKFQRGNATLYVNGVASPIGGYDSPGDLPDTSAHLLLGNLFEGALDEVAIYDKALSPERIRAHYEAGKP